MTARMPQRLAWVTLAALFALMTLGNVVSATGSGLACPDWPLCHGRLIPPLRPDVLVEYGHRLVAALASALLVATTVLTMRGGRAPRMRRLGVTLLVLLGLQIALGGVTVLLKLPHLVSTAHLVNALLIFAGLLAICWASGSRAPARAPAKVGRLALAGVAALLVQLAVGGYVRHTGAGLACPDFPLCSGDVLPGHWLAVVHWVHRWLGVTLLGLFVHIGIAARGTAVAAPARLAALLAAIQVALGILAVVLQLTPALRATHAAVGYALWGVLVWIGLRAAPASEAVVTARPPARSLLEAAGGS